MRPYLAVLKDSLREAMSSRVLWFALATIALVLLLLAPFALRTETATRLRPRELADAERFVNRLVENAEKPETPGGHIWTLLTPDQQTFMKSLVNPEDENGGPRGRFEGRIVQVINPLLERDDFYKKEAWKDTELDGDLQESLEQPGGSGPELASRNLKILAGTFRRSIRIRDSSQISLTYAGNTVTGVPLTRDQLKPLITLGISSVMSILLGFVGVFASLLVTAFVIPRTFEPGEISLLLSKPVNRSLLLITKFTGSCIFTLACAIAMVGGVWFLLGVRFDIWEPKLLYCIPIYILLFMVYYVVSATAGLIWRNAIVALVVVVLFWLVLFVVGTVKNSMDQFSFAPAQITEIVPTKDRLFAVNGERQLLLYDPTAREWQPVFVGDASNVPAFARRMMFAGVRYRPSWDEKNQRLLTVEKRMSPFGGAARGTVFSGIEADEWERVNEGETPGPVSDLFIDSDNRVLLPGRRGIYQFVGMDEKERKTKEFWNNMVGNVFPASAGKAFAEVPVKDMPRLPPRFETVFDAATDDIFFYGDGEVHHVARQKDGSYAFAKSRDLETEEQAVFTVAGDYVVLALGDGSIRVLNRDNLEDHLSDEFSDGVVPRVAESSTDGSAFGILTHTGEVWLFDGKTGKKTDWAPPEQGEVSAIAFTPEGQLMVGNGRQDVAMYALENSASSKQYTVAPTLVTRVYDWVVYPVFTLLPQPNEVDNLINYMMTGEKSQALTGGGPFQAMEASLQDDRVTFDPWRPLFKNIAFIVVMLAFGCFYVSRKDF